jgi:hypothetical protein
MPTLAHGIRQIWLTKLRRLVAKTASTVATSAFTSIMTALNRDAIVGQCMTQRSPLKSLQSNGLKHCQRWAKDLLRSLHQALLKLVLRLLRNAMTFTKDLHNGSSMQTYKGNTHQWFSFSTLAGWMIAR